MIGIQWAQTVCTMSRRIGRTNTYLGTIQCPCSFLNSFKSRILWSHNTSYLVSHTNPNLFNWSILSWVRLFSVLFDLYMCRCLTHHCPKGVLLNTLVCPWSLWYSTSWLYIFCQDESLTIGMEDVSNANPSLFKMSILSCFNRVGMKH